jgi:hypothetical protein
MKNGFTQRRKGKEKPKALSSSQSFASFYIIFFAPLREMLLSIACSMYSVTITSAQSIVFVSLCLRRLP